MKNNATNSPVLTLVYGAAIAAIYVVLTMVFLQIERKISVNTWVSRTSVK